MYFPYLRGKQYELIALRELSESMGKTNVIHPIIEPVRESTSTLRLTIEQFKEQDVHFTIIINPEVGDFDTEYDQVIEIINQHVEEYDDFQIGILIQPTSDLNHLDSLLADIEYDYPINLIHKGRFPDMEKLGAFISGKEIVYNLFSDPTTIRRYRRIIDYSTKVILSDPFNSKRTNADYAKTPDEFFSDEHNFYEEDGFAGFADYVTIGDDYSDSGFAPYAVAIHLTYEKGNGQIWIRHLVSDSNEDYTDVPGTYREALKKLIVYIDKNNIQSEACDEFREHFSQGHYPGLGSVKKLSIKHHIELIANILMR